MNAPYQWQSEAWDQACAAIERGAHALLIAGARGVGKRDFALHLAARYLCDSASIAGAACGSCESCRWIAAGTHPDFALIEPPVDDDDDGNTLAATHARSRPIGVDQVRAITELLSLTAHRASGKVIVITPANSLNVAASNALLKNLEEPPAGALFILVADRPAMLLPTVRSRCQSVSIRLHDASSASTWLQSQGVAHPELGLALCGGAPLEAAAIGADAAWSRRRALLTSLCEERFDPIALAETYRDLAPQLVLSWLQKWSFDLLLMRTANRIRYHLDLQDVFAVMMKRVDDIRLSRIHRRLLAMQRHVNHPLNPRLLMEDMLLSCRLRDAE